MRALVATINKLLVNEGNYINSRTIKALMIEAKQYERDGDRAFKVIGQYPITPSTLGPVSRRTIGGPFVALIYSLR